MSEEYKEICCSEHAKKFTFPPMWKDETKMKMLLSTFHPRPLNIENYDTKMTFWMDLIKHYCVFFGKANFSLRELQLQFIRGEQIPACLDTVISAMEQQKQIRLRTEFEYDPLNSWSGWLMNSFVKRPLSRSWLTLKHSIISEDSKARSLVEWVHLGALQSICSEMDIKVLQGNRGKLLHLEGFKTLCKSCHMCVHEKCLPLCLVTLQAHKHVALELKTEKNTQSIHLIKIPAKDDQGLTITEADHAMHRLDITRSSLQNQLDGLEEEIQSNDIKVHQYVKEGKRQLAKTYLRKRHLLEKNHERRSLALFNIETLLSNVNEAQSSGAVIDAYKTGSKALQKVLNDSGLKYDNVDEVLADVRETLDQHREVQDVMSNSAADGVMHDEDELEKELREIMGENEPVLPINICSNNNKPEIIIEDQDLIAMLNDLEVEDGTLSQASHKTLDSL